MIFILSSLLLTFPIKDVPQLTLPYKTRLYLRKTSWFENYIGNTRNCINIIRILLQLCPFGTGNKYCPVFVPLFHTVKCQHIL